MILLFCALLSIAISGHRSGAANNLFHLPILEKLYDEPQFASDAFVQSLRHYASGFWMLLAGMANDRNLLSLFLPLQIVSRLLFFAGVLTMARPLGISGRKGQYFYLLLVALAVPMRGTAPAGDGGLFISEFTHSELANATILFAFALAARRRFGWSMVLVAVTFFINIFMAVWISLPIAFLMTIAVRRGHISPQSLLVQVLWGALLCLPIVAPVLLNLGANREFGKPSAIDYRLFLEEYWPGHFLVWDTPLLELIEFSLIAAAGLAATELLPTRARHLTLTLMSGIGMVWLIGAVVPFVTSSQSILNLHLLRSSAILITVAVLALASGAVQLFGSERAADRLFWGPLLIVSFAITSSLLPLVPLLVVVRHRWMPPTMVVRPALTVALFTMVGIATAIYIGRVIQADRAFRDAQGQWLAVAEWARDRSAPTAVFLLPATNINPGGPLPKSPAASNALAFGHEIFATLAHRVVWSDFKEGGAVMWTPSYYFQWRRRVVETLRLSNLRARLDYARRNGIAAVIDSCDLPNSPTPAFRAGYLCVYTTGK